MHDLSIYKAIVGNIVYKTWGKREYASSGKIVPNIFPRIKRKFPNIAKVKSFTKKENPLLLNY